MAIQIEIQLFYVLKLHFYFAFFIKHFLKMRSTFKIIFLLIVNREKFLAMDFHIKKINFFVCITLSYNINKFIKFVIIIYIYIYIYIYIFIIMLGEFLVGITGLVTPEVPHTPLGRPREDAYVHEISVTRIL